MSKVINFPGVTFNDIDPKEMLQGITDEMDFESVVVVGWTDDDRITLCSSASKTADMLYLLEMGKKAILDASEL